MIKIISQFKLQAFAKFFNLRSFSLSMRALASGFILQVNLFFLILNLILSKFFGNPALKLYKNLNPKPIALDENICFSESKLIIFLSICCLSLVPTYL